MTIYTKSGDDGTTSLYGGKRILKSDLQIEAYGSLDGLMSLIGLVITKVNNKKERTFLSEIQMSLYKIMAFLSGAKPDLTTVDKEIKKIEQYIDKVQSQLPKLNCFILPQGNELSAWFHVLRTICRRAERRVVGYFEKHKKNVPSYNLRVIKYLNRLSDLFFVMGRHYNRGADLKVNLA